jgi:serine/threonine-protein kinase
MNGDRPPEGANDDRTGTGWTLGGRYRLISQVGAGGMAVVWQAYDDVLARTVAVKVMAAHYADDPESRDRIRREARAAAGLSHPNIAQVYDYGEADVGGEIIPYIVMELIRGGTLQERLDDGPVLPLYAMRLCAEIAAALAAAHAEGLAHRDIKPANVMLASTGAKVVDFGIAAAIRPSAPGDDDFEVLGTPAYLAPERLLHDAVEPASDVYALGVLLYRLLSGHSPWTNETTTEMLSAHIYLEPAPLLPMFEVPWHVTALCNRCLAKDPSERPSAREAAALLAHGAGMRVITDVPPAPERTAIDPEPSVLIPAAVPSAPATPAATEVPAPQPEDDAPDAGLADDSAAGSDPAHGEPPPPELPEPGGQPAAGSSPRRAVYVLIAVALLALVAGGVWLLRPTHQQAVASAPAAGPTPAPAASRTATIVPSGASTTAAGTTTAPGGVTVRPTGAVPIATADATPGPTGAQAPTTKATTTTPATADPGPVVTTTTPASGSSERTLSSPAGSVDATCPASDTAQILSSSATKPYKLNSADNSPGPSPAAVFKHGNTYVTMTVTCSGGVPSVTTT